MRLRLLEFCKERKIPLSHLAAWTGIARGSLSRYAHGVQDMTLGQLLKIAEATGSSLHDLVDDREDLRSPFWQKALRKICSDPCQKKDKSWVPRVMEGTRATARPMIRG